MSGWSPSAPLGIPSVQASCLSPRKDHSTFQVGFPASHPSRICSRQAPAHLLGPLLTVISQVSPSLVSPPRPGRIEHFYLCVSFPTSVVTIHKCLTNINENRAVCPSGNSARKDQLGIYSSFSALISIYRTNERGRWIIPQMWSLWLWSTLYASENLL